MRDTRITKHHGFTIVELLIVIVIIAILAAITAIAYNGIQIRAQNSSRVSDAAAWRRIFVMYKSTNGSWPSSMAAQQDYCLGTGFPTGYNNEARCRDYQYQTGGTLYSYKESDSAALMSQLNTVASGPNAKAVVKGEGPNYGAIGPYAQIASDGQLLITTILKASSGQCPSNMSEQFADSGNKMVWCQFKLP